MELLKHFTVMFVNGSSILPVNVEALTAHDAVTLARETAGVSESMCPVASAVERK